MIDLVPVGNPGNANDPARSGESYGAVNYVYSIGKYEVTVAQYTDFLNAVAATDTYYLYGGPLIVGIPGISRSGSPGSYTYSVIGSPNLPVTHITWGAAARFCNWLANGQPTGSQNTSTTEDGSYLLNGAITTTALLAVVRKAGATWVIPNENEWYKAAYHQPAAQGGDADNYWDYPTRTNSEPNSDQPPGDPSIQTNVANAYRDDGLANGYNDGYAVTGSTIFDSSQDYRTEVGAYTYSPSYYGTFDQGGNVSEWNETLTYSGEYRVVRGGTSGYISAGLAARSRSYLSPGLSAGFRVAYVPEPSALALAMVGIASGVLIGWRRARTFCGGRSSSLARRSGKPLLVRRACGARRRLSLARRVGGVVALGALLLLLGPVVARADVPYAEAPYEVAWSRQIGTTDFEASRSVAVDSAGNAYVSGRTLGNLGGPNAGNYDAFLTKHDSSGSLLWSRQIGTDNWDESFGVAMDAAGNAYISGWTRGNLGGPNAGDFDAFLTKYDSSGNLLWSRQIGTISTDESLGVAVDGAGNAYLSGWTLGSLGGPNAGSFDAFLVKYVVPEPSTMVLAAVGIAAGLLIGWRQARNTRGGRHRWLALLSRKLSLARRGRKPLLARRACGACRRPSLALRVGGVVALGALVVLLNPVVARAEAPYEVAWSRQIGTIRDDGSSGVAVDAAGNAYISGSTDGSLGGPNAGGTDAFLTKYDGAGNLLWSRQIGTTADDWSGSVAVDAAGNAYISGLTFGSLDAPNADAFLAKYDGAGDLVWSRQIGTTNFDESYAVAVDGAANAYISGRTLGSLGGPNSGNYDAFLTKYDGAGNLLWSRQIGTTATDVSRGVAVDAAGNAYISGRTLGSLGGPNSGNYDAFLTKYDGAGNLLWSRQIGTTVDDSSGSVAVDAAGHVFISGSTDGSLGGPNAGQNDAFLVKYDGAGNLLWSRQIGATSQDSSHGVAVDAAGNAYISGLTFGSLFGPNAGNYDAFLTKYDGTGNLLWSRQIGSRGGDVSDGVALDAAGNVYISGFTGGSLAGPNAGFDDAFLVKYVVPEPSSFVLAVAGIAAGLLIKFGRVRRILG